MSREDGITRRQFVIGGGAAAAAALVAAGVVGWRSWTVRDYWYRLSGAYGEPGAYPPHYDVQYVYATMPSTTLGRDIEYGVAWPPGHELPGRGGRGLPLCFCLPGRGRGARGVLEGNQRLGDFAAAAIEGGGGQPFALVAVDGGDTYWHRRASGEDSMTMLLDELIPFCREEYGGGRDDRAAIMGWSMGGYGALHAAELRPEPFCGVCAVSPALWRSFDDGVGDAFDSAADYAANDVYAAADQLEKVGVRLDCGEQDPFYEADRAFVAALPFKAEGGFAAGGHNDGYWRRVAPAEMQFVQRSLAKPST